MRSAGSKRMEVKRGEERGREEKRAGGRTGVGKRGGRNKHTVVDQSYVSRKS